MTKWVYSFGAEACDGEASMRNLLGGKGVNLSRNGVIGPSCTAGIYHHHRGVTIIMIMTTAILTR